MKKKKYTRISNIKQKFFSANQRSIISIFVFIVIGIGMSFGYNYIAKGVTFGWLQGSWSGNADTVSVANHTNNQNGWNKFFSKDNNVSADAQLTLNSANQLKTDTTTENFQTGTNTDGVYPVINTNNELKLDVPCLTAPVATAGSGVNQTQITANWNSVVGATAYFLDVSTASNFSSFLSGYNDLNVGNVNNYSIDSLSCGTTYYYRIRANDNACTSASSNVITVSTSACDILPSCGTQVWAEANVNVGVRVNGTTYQNNNGIVEKYCYNNLESNCTLYGGIYLWNEAMQYASSVNCDPCGPTTGRGGVQGICPVGYHIPSDLEWSRYEWCVENTIAPTGTTTLIRFQNYDGLRGSFVDGVGPGSKIKASSADTPSWDGTNSSSFSALPSGQRYMANGSFGGLGSLGKYWTATIALNDYSFTRVFSSGEPKSERDRTRGGNGMSVRCLKD